MREKVSLKAKVKETAVTPWDIDQAIFLGADRRFEARLAERQGREQNRKQGAWQ